jgi:hypothetical protein
VKWFEFEEKRGGCNSLDLVGEHALVSSREAR